MHLVDFRPPHAPQVTLFHCRLCSLPVSVTQTVLG